MKNTIFLSLEKLAGQWTDHLIVINQTDRDEARHNRIVPEASIHYLPGIGIDTSHYSPERISVRQIAEFRHSVSLSEELRLFLLIANPDRDKRHLDSLEALSMIDDQHIVIGFAGRGSFGQIKLRAVRMGILARTRFLGHLDDVRPAILSSVAVILPSLREGLPRTLMESLSLGIPIIVTDIRGARELAEGGCGLIVPPRNPTELSQAMQWVIQNPNLSKEMGLRGRKKMKEYEIERLIVEHERVYSSAFRTHR